MQAEYKIRTKIFRKIFIVMIFSIVCGTLVTGGFTYFYMKPMVEEALLDKRRDMVQSLSKQEVNTLEEIATYAQNITFDDTIQEILKRNTEENTYDYFSGILKMEKRLKEYRMIYGSLIQDIFVMSNKGEALETAGTYGDLTELSFLEKFIAEDVAGYSTKFVWDYHGVVGKKNTVAYVVPIYEKNSILYSMGKLVILLDVDKMNSRFKTDEDIHIKLETPEGEVLIDNLGEKQVEEKFYTDTLGKNCWKIYYTIDNREIESVIGHANYFMTLIIALFLCGILIFTVALFVRFMAPLDTLLQGMQKTVQEKRMVRIELHTGDECEEAASVFNQMVESIEKRTAQLIESEKRQFELQLKMLSYQINPHFIYNTLNAIICMARKHDDDKIIDLTKSFIMLLQSLLRTDLQAMTTVKKEQEYIDNYLHVLQICYRNVPDIIWNVQESVKECQLPRMILYPLVENSVFHGIVPCDRECFLKISIQEENGKVYIKVEDNGVGCTEQELEEIQKCLRCEKIEKHVGLFNVNGRMKLIYKEYCSLNIQSRVNQGTRITFCFESIKD